MRNGCTQKINILKEVIRIRRGEKGTIYPSKWFRRKEGLEFNLDGTAYYNFAGTVKNTGNKLTLHEDVDPLKGRF